MVKVKVKIKFLRSRSNIKGNSEGRSQDFSTVLSIPVNMNCYPPSDDHLVAGNLQTGQAVRSVGTTWNPVAIQYGRLFLHCEQYSSLSGTVLLDTELL